MVKRCQFVTKPIVVMVSENGASVYSASEVAREEFPEYDITVRGAVSIGRRLMDPLSELVKIDPKSIGVGQYQHDVNQTLLKDSLNDVVVSCVNSVGVELNTASKELLSYVSGIGPVLARNIVDYRYNEGPFKNRKELLKVERLGAKAFEQCAGFLRVPESRNVLDNTGVHPESYDAANKLLELCSLTLADVKKGNADTLTAKVNELGEDKAATECGVGVPTLRDIVKELQKPGRDPRAVFEKPAFREDVTTIADVVQGMELEGVVTNVAAFGAFVDIGVHQDGLVHLSELSDNYVSDPASVVKAGDRLQVTVIGVDKARGRISLSAKSKPTIGGAVGGARPGASASGSRRPAPQTSFGRAGGFSCNPFANL